MAKQSHRLRILITAGPTLENIDPVRFLSNRSSGKMGYALAAAAKKSGHHVVLISGPTSLTKPPNVTFIAVESARDMRAAVLQHLKSADIIIKAAAVADYRIQKVLRKKIKKDAKILNLTFVKNPDILKEVGQKIKESQLLVGFAAETHDGLENAQKKLLEKQLDAIVLNDVSRADIGFGSDHNEICLITKKGQTLFLKRSKKNILAKKLIALFTEFFENKKRGTSCRAPTKTKKQK